MTFVEAYKSRWLLKHLLNVHGILSHKLGSIASLELCDGVVVLIPGRFGDEVLGQELFVIDSNILLQVEVVFDNTDSENLSSLSLQSRGLKVKGVELFGFVLVRLKLGQSLLFQLSMLGFDFGIKLLILVK